MKLGWASLLAAIVAPSAMAQTEPVVVTAVEDARIAKVNEAVTAINNKHPADAIALLDPVLAEYETQYAAEKRPVYCAENPAEAARYMLGAGTRPQPGRTGRGTMIIGMNWCTALWAKGFALIDLERVADAVPYLERSALMAPGRAQYVSELGYAYQALKRWQESLDTFARAADAAQRYEGDERKRQLTRAWWSMGYTLIELQRWDEAEAILRKCLELDPDHAKAKSELEYIAQMRPAKSS